MKPFTRTLTIASALAVFVAGQLLYAPADGPSRQAFFRVAPENPADLKGMDCVSKKLILPKKPKEPEKPVQSLQNALARYGE
ncbi:hypothetical protein [Parapedobacter sp. 2B3]|uniref:hypothetical protein n=1 Tax=Parapedobacter sp. 2B3 TaxID=3342381 RepID=UPI0035B5F4C5